ncbi:hypothetical protein EDD38_5625 [Kitasatospora cineracea]|uniref:Uncharacterized protein n=2 Tax=Kitasatospora cineracea TaxID=88074 RepID=A0A3N4RAW1_9ACTN|nr:hypothetical protein EDD38_5625 [Kitasatospora cineracea]
MTTNGMRAGRRLAAAAVLGTLGWVCAKYGHDAYLDAVPRRLGHCLDAAPVPATAWAATVAGPLLETAAGTTAALLLRPTARSSTAALVTAALITALAGILLLVTGWGLTDAIGGPGTTRHPCSGM